MATIDDFLKFITQQGQRLTGAAQEGMMGLPQAVGSSQIASTPVGQGASILQSLLEGVHGGVKKAGTKLGEGMILPPDSQFPQGMTGFRQSSQAPIPQDIPSGGADKPKQVVEPESDLSGQPVQPNPIMRGLSALSLYLNPEYASAQRVQAELAGTIPISQAQLAERQAQIYGSQAQLSESAMTNIANQIKPLADITTPFWNKPLGIPSRPVAGKMAQLEAARKSAIALRNAPPELNPKASADKYVKISNHKQVS